MFKATLAGVALLAGTATASAPIERLSAPAVQGFVVGYEAANHEQSVRELVPEGETVEDWSRMITDQRFFGMTARITPVQFANLIKESVEANCTGSRVSSVIALHVNGRPAAKMRADCPNSKVTGKPETFFMLLISGKQDMHGRQVAFTKLPNPKEVDWAEGILAKTRLCLSEGGDNAC